MRAEDKIIRTEYGGLYEEVKLQDIQDYLSTIAEMSNGAEDFVTKSEYGLTDETNGFESSDKDSLREWYNNIYLNS